MQVIYGFVYFFLLAVIGSTFLLSIFVFRPMRKLLHKVQTKFQDIFNNKYIGYFINFTFAIIFIILADSIRTFFIVNQHLDQNDTIALRLDSLEASRTGEHTSMLGSLKEYREYYMAERNIMLTCSVLFSYFVFRRLFFNIRKLADEEHLQENPQAKSVILDAHNTEVPPVSHIKSE